MILGIKSHFSVGKSTLSPKQIVALAKEKGYDTVALCDDMSVAGLVELAKAASAEEMKYIIGASVNFFEDANERVKTKPLYALKFFARNEAGLQKIFKLLSRAASSDHFYYTPRADITFIRGADLRDVVVLTGDMQSVFTYKNSAAVMNALQVTGADLLIEQVAVKQPVFERINEIGQTYIDAGFKSVVTRPVLYPESASDLRDIAQAVATNSNPNHPLAPKPYTTDFELKTQAEFGRLCGEMLLDDSMNQDLYDSFEYEWVKKPMSLPKLATDDFAELVRLCKLGFVERQSEKIFGETLDSSRLDEYKNRLKTELSVINKMGFSAYFLLVHYVVNYSKDNTILVGPARGSAAGSLVAYLLKITDVDPLRFGLFFERFLNPDRLDYPDIDLDFMSSRRGEIIEHLVSKFGIEYVSGIANYNTLASASALRDVARVSGLKPEDYDCSKLVPKEHGNSLSLEESATQVTQIEDFSKTYPREWRYACALQGLIKSTGQHAAGIVVAGEPINTRGVTLGNKEYPVVCWDKRVVEDWGLIKLDVLGLSTLDIIYLAVKKANEAGKHVDLWSIPLDDKDTLNIFAQGRTKGVFQFEGGMARNLCREIAQSGDFTFEDAVAVNALNRPGPLESGLADKYVKIRQGRFSPEYPHPKAEPALEETHSVIIFQEQIMQLARDVCGFTMAESDHLRKAMGKKQPDEMKKMNEKFVEGATKNGMLEEDANLLFEQIEKFAAYGFNKSHACAYTLISYMSAYLKAHYAGEFYAASMSILADDKIKLIAKEATQDDFIVMPPDVNHSTDSFEIVYNPATSRKLLYSPLTAVKNVSAKVCQHIMEVRAATTTGAFESYKHFCESVTASKCNKRAKENLDKVGAFASIESGQAHALHSDRLRDQKELMGALAVADVKPDRHIDMSPYLKDQIAKLYEEMNKDLGIDIVNCAFGKKPKFVVITDKPSYFEIQDLKSMAKKSSSYVLTALKEAGLKQSEGYYTQLVKTMPVDKNPSREEIAEHGEYLKRELDLLNPPLVILAGTKAIRYFFPESKGSAEELSRTVEYDKNKDRNYMFCINPQMIYIKPEKQDLLNTVFHDVAELFDLAV